MTPHASDRQRALLRGASEEVFNAPTRYVKVTRLGPYLKEVFDQTAAEKGWGPADEHTIATASSKFERRIRSADDAIAWMTDVVDSAREA